MKINSILKLVCALVIAGSVVNCAPQRNTGGPGKITQGQTTACPMIPGVDSDGDCYKDTTEIANNTDPNNPNDYPTDFMPDSPGYTTSLPPEVNFNDPLGGLGNFDDTLANNIPTVATWMSLIQEIGGGLLQAITAIANNANKSADEISLCTTPTQDEFDRIEQTNFDRRYVTLGGIIGTYEGEEDSAGIQLEFKENNQFTYSNQNDGTHFQGTYMGFDSGVVLQISNDSCTEIFLVNITVSGCKNSDGATVVNGLSGKSKEFSTKDYIRKLTIIGYNQAQASIPIILTLVNSSYDIPTVDQCEETD